VSAESQHHERVPRHAQHRTEETAEQRVGVTRERFDEATVDLCVGTERLSRHVDGPVEQRGRPIVERMCEWDSRVDPLEPVLGQRKRAQER
jgi:hypothetical protein